jgi:hypothetical protein
MQTLAVGSMRFGFEFDRYLQGSKEFNAIRVVLTAAASSDRR